MSDSHQHTAYHNRRAPRAIGCCIMAPIVVVLCLFAAYKIDNIDQQITLPTHAMPADNARDYFHRAFITSKLMKHKSPYDMVGTPAQNYTLANYRWCAQDAKPALTIMREGLKHPYMNPAVRSANTTFPMYAECRDLERVNAGAADYYAVSGDPGRAMQMRLDGLEMGVMIPRGGVLISALVGIACESISESRMEPLIPHLSSAELKAAADRLDKIASKRIPFADVITEEGYAQTANVLESLKDPKVRANPYKAALDMMGGGLDDGTNTWRERISVRMAALKYTMQSKSVIIRENSDWYASMAKEAGGAYLGPSKVPVPNNLIAELTGTWIDQTRLRWVSIDAAFSLIRLEVALYRYKKDHGVFPASLSDFTPTYLAGIPVDSCGGKALHYVVQQGGTGVLLYSIGADMKDDSGRPAKNVGALNGDIVAGKLRSNKPILYSNSAK